MESALTIILPTRNRSKLCEIQVRFLQRAGVRHRVIVADSSDEANDALRAACTGTISYRRYKPSISLSAKMVAVARSVVTPYVAMMTDDDISFPHAIDSCMEFLQGNPDHIAAQGYVLDAGVAEDCIDIHGIRWYVPGVVGATPLKRLARLMQRYQPVFWAVFRAEAFRRALEKCHAARGAIFQELAFASTLAMLGATARLPTVYTLRGEEGSLTPPVEVNPLFWFLKDTKSFVSCYARYRRLLMDLHGEWDVADLAESLPLRDDDALRQAIDVIHATYWGREVDTGRINHIADILAGDASGHDPAIASFSAVPPRDRTMRDGDRVSLSTVTGRRIVWRASVLNAEPRSEITIDDAEVARASAALDDYGRQ